MGINEKFRKKYTRLVEYKVQDLNDSKSLNGNGQQTGFIKEEDPTPNSSGLSEPEIDQSPVEMPDSESDVEPNDNNTDDSKLEKKTEILKDLAQNHTEKIDSILHYLENMTFEIEGIKQKEQEFDSLKNHVQQLEKQVDFLTPPTPEESLQKMVRISGGQTIDQYWTDYLAKNGKSVNGKIPYYANGVLTNEPAQIQNVKYSDDELKNSLGL